MVFETLADSTASLKWGKVTFWYRYSPSCSSTLSKNCLTVGRSSKSFHSRCSSCFLAVSRHWIVETVSVSSSWNASDNNFTGLSISVKRQANKGIWPYCHFLSQPLSFWRSADLKVLSSAMVWRCCRYIPYLSHTSCRPFSLWVIQWRACNVWTRDRSSM